MSRHDVSTRLGTDEAIALSFVLPIGHCFLLSSSYSPLLNLDLVRTI